MDYADARDFVGDPLEAALRRELEVGETIRWKGRALPGSALGGFGLYVFAIPWTAFSLFWTAMAFGATQAGAWDGSGAGLLAYAFPLFGLPFIIIGLVMLGMPFLAMAKARKTMFAVTDRRLLRLTRLRELESESIPAERIGALTRKEKGNGAGSLQIAVGVGRDSDGDRQTEHFTIGKVANVRQAEAQVQRLLQEARRKHREPAADAA